MKKEFILNGENEEFEVLKSSGGNKTISYKGQEYSFELVHREKNEMVLKKGDILHRIFYGSSAKDVFISIDGQDAIFEKKSQSRSKKLSQSQKGYASPMPGKILKVFIQRGDQVKKGQVLLIMEAMKMEHSIIAVKDGKIKEVYFKDGDYVDGEIQLLEVE